jgi:hypothetical protein
LSSNGHHPGVRDRVARLVLAGCRRRARQLRVATLLGKDAGRPIAARSARCRRCFATGGGSSAAARRTRRRTSVCYSRSDPRRTQTLGRKTARTTSRAGLEKEPNAKPTLSLTTGPRTFRRSAADVQCTRKRRLKQERATGYDMRSPSATSRRPSCGLTAVVQRLADMGRWRRAGAPAPARLPPTQPYLTRGSSQV